MPEALKALFSLLYERYGESFVIFLNKIAFEIAKSDKFSKTFSVCGFSLFSSILIFAFIRIATVNENIRSNQELARTTSEHIQSRFYEVDGLLQLLEVEKNRNDSFCFSDLEAKLVNLGFCGITNIKKGSRICVYGELDPTNADTIWNRNRWNEIMFSLSSLASDKAETFLVSYERTFRSKEETVNGINCNGNLILARVWKNNNIVSGIVAVMPIGKIAEKLRVGAAEYESGNYDYIIDQNGNLIFHPTPFIMYGTDAQGKPKRGAHNKEEVGNYPINTRDADWIPENNILNTAFGRMLNGQFTSVIYKNLKKQLRLTSFNLIELNNGGHEIKGLKIGIVSGKGLNRIDAIIGSLLLESPSSLYTVLISFSSVYMVLIGFWIFILAKTRKLQEDILLLSPNMSADTAKRLKFLPLSKLGNEQRLLSNFVILLVSVDEENFQTELISTIMTSQSLFQHFKNSGWATERLSIKEFLVVKEFHKNENSPSAVLSKIKDHILDFEKNGLSIDYLKKNGVVLFYTIGNIYYDGVKSGLENGDLLNFSGPAIVEALNIWERSKNNITKENNVILFYKKEIVEQKNLERIGQIVQVLQRDYYEISSEIFSHPE